jgi:glycosyltransferase involved in cell wall biosynthesis
MYEPIVSIAMIIYNQEKYIGQAIEGVLIQKTNFPYELVISEDLSSDRTREVCREYQKKYPQFIRLILNDKNIGSMANWINNVSACKGKYIAFCEGDDYWMDSYKLQKEVDFLEKNQDCGLVHTNFDMLYDVSGEIHRSYHSEKEMPQGNIYEELLHDNFIWTVTIMARRRLLMDSIQDVDLINQNWPMGDYPMCLAMSLRSKIGYIDDVTSTYRVLVHSAIHSPDPIKKIMLTKSYNDVKLYFIEKYGCTDETRIKIITAYYKFLLRSSFSIGDYELARIGRELFLRTKSSLPWNKQWKERCIVPFCINSFLFLSGRMMYVPMRFLQSRLKK